MQLPSKYASVYNDIKALLSQKTEYDDGSYGPVLVRLAWHASGTYNIADSSGGSCTGLLSLENKDPANNGLEIAREFLLPIKKKYDWITYADLWTLAGCVAIEHMGGPSITWRPGRPDISEKSKCPAHGRLPDASQGSEHVDQVFCKNMGFTIQETVALIGAHVLGRCHKDRSGFHGKWAMNPIRFSNQLQQKWTIKEWDGPEQFRNHDDELMMLPTDMALLQSPWRKYVDLYANDKNQFFTDFTSAFTKLLELGMPPSAASNSKL